MTSADLKKGDIFEWCGNIGVVVSPYGPDNGYGEELGIRWISAAREHFYGHKRCDMFFYRSTIMPVSVLGRLDD